MGAMKSSTCRSKFSACGEPQPFQLPCMFRFVGQFWGMHGRTAACQLEPSQISPDRWKPASSPSGGFSKGFSQPLVDQHAVPDAVQLASSAANAPSLREPSTCVAPAWEKTCYPTLQRVSAPVPDGPTGLKEHRTSNIQRLSSLYHGRPVLAVLVLGINTTIKPPSRTWETRSRCEATKNLVGVASKQVPTAGPPSRPRC
ncbi:hypothetical protein BKA66DRAFT_53500 [Pyrenochaeta sp. MPI-SDFR-AT-0127]|nr:hypothetical protein BKA66DRAFT_53500 [Pyrenochaeta sp. MPI-SDFR-AT-0127]